MLEITIPAREYWDPIKEEFVYDDELKIAMEHSLISLHKWESKWHKPYLVKDVPKTTEETLDYYQCMTITKNVSPDAYKRITPAIQRKIQNYIDDPMTATKVYTKDKGGKGETLTAELIYAYMFMLNIPYDCRTWHLNQLLTLIQVCGVKNSPSKKMTDKEVLQQQADLNKARRAALAQKG